jgi:hypothetical protein
MILESRPDIHPYKVELKIGLDDWLVDEQNGEATSSNGMSIAGKCEFQSQLTKDLVSLILINGTSNLPTLAQSAAQHRVFIKSLMEHWNLNMDNNLDNLPIT